MSEVERQSATAPAAAVPAAAPARRKLPAAASGWRWLPLSAAVIVLDRLAKLWITHHFAPLERVHVLKVLDIILTYNTGAAFSFLAEASGWQRWLFVGIAVTAAVVIVVLLKRGGSAWYGAGLALILGGALGNLFDRLVIGKVVDFLLFHYGGWAYPAFNVADSAITVGAAILIFDSLRRHDDGPAHAAKGTR